MGGILRKAEFVTSVFDLDQLPRSGGEIVFIGRSNVGKSSLINVICEKDICFTSKKPGRTKSLNFYLLDPLKRTFLVDLPGYGFASATKQDKENWQTMLPSYLEYRQEILMIYIIIDSKVGFLDNDREALNMIHQYHVPFSIILNKIDKTKKQEVDGLLGLIKIDPLLNEAQDQYTVSARKGNIGQIGKLKNDICKLFK